MNRNSRCCKASLLHRLQEAEQALLNVPGARQVVVRVLERERDSVLAELKFAERFATRPIQMPHNSVIGGTTFEPIVQDEDFDDDENDPRVATVRLGEKP